MSALTGAIKDFVQIPRTAPWTRDDQRGSVVWFDHHAPLHCSSHLAWVRRQSVFFEMNEISRQISVRTSTACWTRTWGESQRLYFLNSTVVEATIKAVIWAEFLFFAVQRSVNAREGVYSLS
jgi:hypothetical protein